MAKHNQGGIGLQLIVREYLSMLKESGELDQLLADLLLCMEIEPISKAQVGVRQYGVDIAAVGPDPEDAGTEKVFLFTIKAGDVDRRSWDAPKQGVRCSLNEIIDVYLPKCLDKKCEGLLKKIVLCCNGDLKQEADASWKGFTQRNASKEGVEFDFWGADRLSLYVTKYFLDEYLFPESAQKKMRRSLALVGLSEYDLSHFYDLVEETLFGRNLPTSKRQSAEKKRLKALRLVHLALRILFYWAQEEGNLKPPLMAAERTLLRVWDWMRKLKLLRNKKTLLELLAIYQTYKRVAVAFLNKVDAHCHTRDGLFGCGHGGEEVEYPIRTFEIIGILGTLGLGEYSEYATTGERENYKGMMAISEMLISVIQNNPAATIPCFDGQSIDICLGLLLLGFAGRKEVAAKWIEDLVGKICFAYRIGRHFPVSTDSYEDLIALEIGQGDPKEKLTSCCTIFPILAQWCAILNLENTYKELRASVEQVFPHSSMQVWYPNEKTETVLYKEDASLTGSTLEISFPKSLAEVKQQMQTVWDHVMDPKEISCCGKNGFPTIGLIASRHFRTPIMPMYWQKLVLGEGTAEKVKMGN